MLRVLRSVQSTNVPNSHRDVEVQRGVICSAVDLIALERVRLFSAPVGTCNSISLQSSVSV